jgi:hypothetical protein
MAALPHPHVLIRHPEVHAEGEPVIGPRFARTRWLAPQDDGARPPVLK